LGLRFAEIALYFDLLRECYEAFVIYSFYQLLVTALGGEQKLVSILAKKPDHPHVFPFCYLPKWRMSDRFHIPFNAEEMARLQAAVEQKQRERAASAAARSERKEGNDIESGTVVAGSNPNPDYSAAASSPELLRAPGAPIEKPIFTTHLVPPTYLSPYSRPHHSDFLTHTQLGTLQSGIHISDQTTHI
jgi:hypothetical protein